MSLITDQLDSISGRKPPCWRIKRDYLPVIADLYAGRRENANEEDTYFWKLISDILELHDRNAELDDAQFAVTIAWFLEPLDAWADEHLAPAELWRRILTGCIAFIQHWAGVGMHQYAGTVSK